MGHIIALRDIGMEAVQRETFEIALPLGRKTLEKTGRRAL
jgi:glutathione-regulated potassium-efflux system ancillary protein KefC